ncbi:MAG: SMC-Scp complex subunit ScpB [Acidimicrobiia bacterium]|nr:SMC-Scp complex subunit ScpB [Acidimicrobiia bacterium]
MQARGYMEAILFVAEQPIPAKELAEVLEVGFKDVLADLEAWAAELGTDPGRGIELREVADGWRLYTKSSAYPYLERYTSTASATRLSGAALEVLAVVAYRQPVSRGQIGEIRGVDSDSAIRTLERRGLIEEAGRLNTPGNPAIYRTSTRFLEKLGLRDLAELPPLADHVPPAAVVETLEETFRVERADGG